MRPIQLTLQAFGPFAAQQVIDFRAFGHAPLFLINGPTGAGKSSILDAICYALYGETTGSERSGDQMRCDYAPDSMLTEVQFIFELDQRRFMLTRSPDQEVAKQRGEGTTKKNHAASLVELLESGEEKLIAHRPTPVGKAVLELIGLDVKQFRQVMVIPQGKFRELLIANSKEREQIFGQLFQTQIYVQIERELLERAAGIRKQKEQFDHQIKGALDVTSLSSEEALQAEILAIKPLVQRSEQAYQASQKQLDALKRQWNDAQELQKQFSQQAQLAAEKTAMLAQQPAIEALRKSLQQAQKAARLDLPYQQNREAQRQLDLAKQAQVAKQQAFALAEKQLEEATFAYQQAAKSAEQVEPLNQQLYQLEGIGKKFAALEEQKKLHHNAKQQWLTAQQGVEQALLKVQMLETQLQAQREEVEKVHQQKSRLEAKQLTQAQMSDHITLRLKQQSLVKKVTELTEQFKQVDRRYQTAQTDAQQARQQADQLELRWHTNQAAELAQRLSEGEACPVCGSHTHPNIAQFSSDVVTKEQVKQAREGQKKAEASEIEWLKQHQQVKSELSYFEQEQQQVAELIAQKQIADLATLQEQDKQLTQEIEQLSRLNPQQLEVKIAQLEQELRTTQSQAEQQKSALEQVKQREIEAQTQVSSLQAEISSDFTHVDEVRERYSVVHKQIKALQQAEQSARTHLTQAQNHRSAAQSSLTSANEQCATWTKEWQRMQQVWQAALSQSPFTDQEHYLQARVDEASIVEMEGKIRQFEQLWSTLQGKLDNLHQTLTDKQPPHLAEIQASVEAQQSDLSAKLNDFTQQRSRLDSLQQVSEKLIRLHEHNAALEKEYQIYGTLSDIASGKTGAKVSLHRFVLGVLLEDVLIQASQRLQRMSKGRYWLKRKEDRAKGNAGSGLDLMVEDAYTGKWRDVATLSGGESFMAALSLALGLSDVVQSYSGGIRLETLFIDEGFGSLDPESLDLAIQTLIDLQQGGRCIGIISHVAELKEQIALRLDVETSVRGSIIKLIV
ncbi:AAA family ATPase [Vibrio cincinnatiensis]|uniref:AAA family ATPase n=1 Tax=Vibrio cincinnatiensis TaxID=675 RepID=UPI001EDF2C01|nr:SMC family ATPase [Vibrio cincinnatiensis]MCG3728926.1 SMC family ATPase [Vibrio cincinnatiensis]